ncbi:MAG: P-loop NTPase [Rhodospirillaceae bacterium]|nr:P-loop NTPase [Rhodospirillaceae bacterium]
MFRNPILCLGVLRMSFGFWLGDAPAVMRGPMVTNYVQQFPDGVAWDGLDYLPIDLPPGTGDIQLTITQAIQLDGALIVTTPHALALAERFGVPLLCQLPLDPDAYGGTFDAYAGDGGSCTRPTRSCGRWDAAWRALR